MGWALVLPGLVLLFAGLETLFDQITGRLKTGVWVPEPLSAPIMWVWEPTGWFRAVLDEIPATLAGILIGTWLIIWGGRLATRAQRSSRASTKTES
jgi:hypothetical protein